MKSKNMANTKFFIALAIILFMPSAFADSFSCEAYCGYFSRGFSNGEFAINYRGNSEKVVSAGGSSRAEAFNEMQRRCNDIASNYVLYTDSSYRAYATPSNSCSRD